MLIILVNLTHECIVKIGVLLLQKVGLSNFACHQISCCLFCVILQSNPAWWGWLELTRFACAYNLLPFEGCEMNVEATGRWRTACYRTAIVP
jgi:hypothetical protein